MPARFTIDPAHTSEAEWIAVLRDHLNAAAAAGEVVDVSSRIETLSPAEAARRLGVDRSTISRKIKAGEIATIRVGSHHRIARREFERYRDSLAPSPLFTYREFAETISGGEDWHFAARQLRELVLQNRYAVTVEDADAIHRDPGLVGVPGWDAIIGGVASIAGRDRVSSAAVLDWCFEPERYCTSAVFDPFGVPEKYFWIDYLRTPIELRVRNVVYPAGNLEGVRAVARREFTASEMRELLTELDKELQRLGKAASLFIVGGAAMALAYNADRASAGIDATFEPRDVVLDAAAVVARRFGLDKNWLSEAVRDFMPPVADDHARGERIGPALVIEIASPEYILAMKSMTTRKSDGDLADAAHLCRMSGVSTEAELEAIVRRYFPGKGFGAQELFFERIIDALSG